MFGLTWVAYFTYYFCRKNLSVLMPLLTERGYRGEDLAHAVFFYSLAYAGGQVLMGSLSDRFGPRLVVSAGMFLSVAANVAMGFSDGVAAVVALQFLNGLAQSCGWSGLLKIMAWWFPATNRGVVMSWWSTNYVLGGFVATILATWAATGPLWPILGFRRGFWIPAAILALAGLVFALFVRNQPGVAAESSHRERIRVPVSSWLSAPLMVIAAMYFCIKLTRYAFLFWFPLYMTEQLAYSADVAGYTSSLYELIGFGGVLLAGYASDRVFQSRRFPVGTLMMAGLAGACFLHPWLSTAGWWANAAGIALIGILTYGPDTLMSAAAVQDLAPPEAAASAAGFVNGVGSVGQVFSPYVVAWLVKAGGWDTLFYCFVVLSLAGSLLLATQWRVSPVARFAEKNA